MNRTVYRSGGVVVRSVRREVQRRFNSYKTGQLLLSSPVSLPPFSLCPPSRRTDWFPTVTAAEIAPLSTNAIQFRTGKMQEDSECKNATVQLVHVLLSKFVDHFCRP